MVFLVILSTSFSRNLKFISDDVLNPFAMITGVNYRHVKNVWIATLFSKHFALPTEKANKLTQSSIGVCLCVCRRNEYLYNGKFA